MTNALDLSVFGPLAGLIGTWDGTKGSDTSPGKPDESTVDVESGFKEQWRVDAIFPHTENREQALRQVGCDIDAWRPDPSTAGKVGGEPFHGERGFFVWDPANNMVVKSFAVPRGIVVNAGGTVEPGATEFELVAEAGSETFGISQNPWLVENFKVVRYTLRIKLNGDGTFDYWQNTELDVRGHDKVFDHIDENHMVLQA